MAHSRRGFFFAGKNSLLKAGGVFVTFLAGAFFSLEKTSFLLLLKAPYSTLLLKASADALLIQYSNAQIRLSNKSYNTLLRGRPWMS